MERPLLFQDLASGFPVWDGRFQERKGYFHEGIAAKLATRCGAVRVRRFYFNLEGHARAIDTYGRVFPDAPEAFKAAQNLAQEIANVRPVLCGNTSVVMTERNCPDVYCVRI